MKTFIYHIHLNISDKNKSFPFYKDLLTYFDYKIIFEGEKVLGMGSNHTDFWLIETEDAHKDKGYHRKSTGLNHISFGVESKDAVDRFIYDFVNKHGIDPLYDSPREYPEYEEGYYAVFFEDPDRIKLEVTYKPNFSKKLPMQ